MSKFEETFVRSSVPLPVEETEEITVLGQKGVWVNKSEVLNWRGPVPISQYRLNEDPNPEVINKTSGQPVEYTQDIAIRYLRPPTPPAPGDLIIKQETTVQAPIAPPVIIRQHAPPVPQAETVVIREAPPEPPAVLPRQVINISGKVSSPPDRKVIIEKLPQLPPKPANVVIERWLPYSQPKRRVVFEGSAHFEQHSKPRNTIINWQAPPANIKRNVNYLGVVKADPREYISKYGSTLKRSHEFPSFVVEAEGNNYQKVASETISREEELFGDLDALKYLDLATLEREGLTRYRDFLIKRGIQLGLPTSTPQPTISSYQQTNQTNSHYNEYNKTSTGQSVFGSVYVSRNSPTGAVFTIRSSPVSLSYN